MKHKFEMDPALDTPGDSRLNSTKWNDNHVMPKISEPADPEENESIMWMSDGTGAGDEGDIMIKVNMGGVVKYATLVDFSAAPEVLTFGDDKITFGDEPLEF